MKALENDLVIHLCPPRSFVAPAIELVHVRELELIDGATGKLMEVIDSYFLAPAPIRIVA